MYTLKAGTILYHGTDCDEFDEAEDGLDGPAWLSDSKEVAEYFASRPGGWGGVPRVIEYRLAEDLALPEIHSQADMAALADEHNLSLVGVEDMRESVANSDLPGWIVPHNYPTGADILVSQTHLLDYVVTHEVSAQLPRSKQTPSTS